MMEIRTWRARLGAVVCLAVTLIVGVGSCVITVEEPPPNAEVVVALGYYLPAIPGFAPAFRELDPHAYITTLKVAEQQGYARNPDWDVSGLFAGEEQSLLRYWFECFGLAAKKTRWNPDGSWKW